MCSQRDNRVGVVLKDIFQSLADPHNMVVHRLPDIWLPKLVVLSEFVLDLIVEICLVDPASCPAPVTCMDP